MPWNDSVTTAEEFDRSGSGAAGSAGLTIRLLTLNAHQGFTALRRRNVLSEIRDALRVSDADLVFLQEIGGHDTSDDAHQYEVLADRVWSQYAYGRNAVTSGGHHGNALLSKYPIIRWDNVDVSIVGTEPRGMLHCVIDLPQQHLHALCVHLGLSESQRSYQVDRLVDWVGSAVPADAPLVIAGDFNDWRGRAHARLINGTGLQEIHAQVLGRPARTFPAGWPLLSLDRIYVRNLEHRPVRMPRRPWARLSDHAPLAGEVRMA